MSITSKDLKILLQKSGNRCAFPGCGELLLHTDPDHVDEKVILSNIAHIVAQSNDGPRGRYSLPIEERDKESNLLLLCEKHHTVIDSEPQKYTVERLRQIKEDHEKLIQDATGRAVARQSTSNSFIKETLFSTLFEVTQMPMYVYYAPSKFGQLQTHEIRTRIVSPKDKTEIYPYIIREGNLYAFQDLRHSESPFQDVVNRGKAHPVRAEEFWNDPIKSLWFADLLNKSINKLTGRKGLMWDREHRRYYFQPDEPGEVKEIKYRPLNQLKSSKQVVWQPINRITKEPRPYWIHRAVNLKFHQVNNAQWCLSIRPEFRITKDGFKTFDAERIGGKVTRKKSRMFNYDLLSELNFWRDFLCESEPRIILKFGKGQHLIISSNMIQSEIEWPGIPDKYAKPFKNIDYQEDLFTWAKLSNLEVDSEGDETEDIWLEEEDDDE